MMELGVIRIKNAIQLIILFVFVGSCSNAKAPEISDVELINCKDSVIYWEESSRKSFKSIVDTTLHTTKYVFSDSLEGIASYSDNALVAIGKKLNGSYIMLIECFRNGQAKGIVEFNDNGVIHGRAKYYYSNGRVKETGYWASGNKVKEWKTFDRNGRLEQTTIYSEPVVAKE